MPKKPIKLAGPNGGAPKGPPPRPKTPKPKTRSGPLLADKTSSRKKG